MAWAVVLLVIAILIEVAATSALPRADGFRDPLWSAVVVGGYASSVWLLSIVVVWLPVSTTYAVWSGLGTALVAVVGVTWLDESWDWLTVVGLTMIVLGVVALNVNGAH